VPTLPAHPDSDRGRRVRAGFTLEVDRGNVIKQVRDESPAAVADLKVGDVVQQLNGVPIHSFADARFALDRAPKTGAIEVEWRRDDTVVKAKLSLRDGWRKSDISWRPSMQHYVASARLYGTDLTSEEKKVLGLPAKRLAFRQQDSLTAQARAAGVRAGDIILGIEDKPLEMDVSGFLHYVQRNYLVGDRVTVNVIRDGRRMNLTMPLLR
jgi:S1-C subfamily serine protease